MEINWLSFLSQAGIAIFGCTAIWLVGNRDDRIRRWGYVAGLCSQPFWLYSAITARQWGIVGLSIIYGFSWGAGFYNHWIKRHSAVIKDGEVTNP